VMDPELSNPLAASAWELALLRHHLETKVATAAKVGYAPHHLTSIPSSVGQSGKPAGP
jgi:hypothetical protein